MTVSRIYYFLALIILFQRQFLDKTLAFSVSLNYGEDVADINADGSLQVVVELYIT